MFKKISTSLKNIGSKRLFHTIDNKTIKINRKEVAKLNVVFHTNNELHFNIKDYVTHKNHTIKMKLHDVIFDSINDTPQGKELMLEVGSINFGDIPLKTHFLTKYSKRNHGRKNKPVTYNDPRVTTF